MLTVVLEFSRGTKKTESIQDKLARYIKVMN